VTRGTALLVPDPAGARLGPFWLAPRVSSLNAVALLFGGFSTICLVTFLTFVQAYLFNVIGIPREEQGSLAGLLVALQETVQIILAGLIGALSDRSGRRTVYVGGLLLTAVGLYLYPLAASENGLILYRIIYAVGITAATVMMSTCFAEYTQEATRGRWMGTVGVFNGLGVVLMATVLARLPALFGDLGFDDAAAIRYSFWVMAACTLLLAALLQAGLQARPPGAGGGRLALLRQTTLGIAAARANPRILLAYGTAFASRGDLVILTTFLSLWVIQAGIDAGMSPGAATARAGMVFGIAQGCALLWSPVMGIMLDRMPRMIGICIAFGLAMLGYLALGLVPDPFGPWMLPASILAGIGEASAVVSAGVLIGQEAPPATRGTVIGTFALAGSAGIVCLTYAGGIAFDGLGPHGPFLLMGGVNGLVLLAALATRRLAPTDTRAATVPAAGQRDAGGRGG
jgi:MFS family permease